MTLLRFKQISGSILTTASVSLNTITFTKGDGTTFNITVNTGSGGGGGGSGSTYPGGPEQSIQFNSGSTFSGSGNFKYDYINNKVILTGSLYVTGGMSQSGGTGHIVTYNTQSGQFSFTASSAISSTTPDLQQVTDVGFTTTNRLVSDDGAGGLTEVNNGYIRMSTGNVGSVQINATQTTNTYIAQLPDKPAASIETFAMLSDLTGSISTGSLLTTASVSLNTITFTKGDGSTFPITVNTGSGGGGGVTQIIAGQNVTISPTSGTGSVTINSVANNSTKLFNYYNFM